MECMLSELAMLFVLSVKVLILDVLGLFPNVLECHSAIVL